jgi:hypothetical protein
MQILPQPQRPQQVHQQLLSLAVIVITLGLLPVQSLSKENKTWHILQKSV